MTLAPEETHPGAYPASAPARARSAPEREVRIDIDQKGKKSLTAEAKEAYLNA